MAQMWTEKTLIFGVFGWCQWGVGVGNNSSNKR